MGDENKDIFEKTLAEDGSACSEALQSNWDGLLAAGILEGLQWGMDFFLQFFRWPLTLMSYIPFFGLMPVWFRYFLSESMDADWSRTFAHGA